MKTYKYWYLLILACAVLSSSLCYGEGLEPIRPLQGAGTDPRAVEEIELGKKLFFDRRLSGDGTMSCAVCHNPDTGYSDGLSISLSYPTTKNWRNSPTLINIGYNNIFFMDGRASTLEEQSLFPIMSNFEMNQNLDFLEEELKEVPEYVRSFKTVFGGEINRERIAKAIASFQRTITSGNAPIDRYLTGDKGALTPEQKKGYEIFIGKGRCVKCHNGANLTDNRFYNLGVPDDPEVMNDPRVAVTMRFTAKVSGYKEYRTLHEDPGRYLVTKDPKDWKAFKTPTLREIALTGPYLHNGIFDTIDEVIDFLDKGGGRDQNKTSILIPLLLSSEEKRYLKTFLVEALKGDLVIMRTPEVP